MEDKTIIDLFVQRNERAITETAEKYGAYCAAVAGNLLDAPEDAAQIVNDVWLAAWEDIPPSQPACLRTYLGRIARELAMGRYRRLRSKNRCVAMETLLAELGECMPDPDGVERQIKIREPARVLRDWLDGLAPEERQLFVRRYWYGAAVNKLAREAGVRQREMDQRLQRLRRSLKARLEQEGGDL